MNTHEELIAKLRAQEVALGDALDVLNTPRAQGAYRTQKAHLARLISALRNRPLDLLKPASLLADCEARRAAVLEKQRELEQAIEESTDPATCTDARDRDKAADHQYHLMQQLRLLHDGRLLCAPGVTYERLVDLDMRVYELQEQIANIQASLDSYVEQAEALVGAPVDAPSNDGEAGASLHGTVSAVE